MSLTGSKQAVLPILLFVLSVPFTSAQERITLGLTTRTGGTSLPYVIAEEKGFFKGEGLNAIFAKACIKNGLFRNPILHHPIFLLLHHSNCP